MGQSSSVSIFSEHFIFVKVLGKGGFGTVALAERKSDGKLYAIKVAKLDTAIDEKYAVTELSNLRKLEHENIVKVYDGWREVTSVVFPFRVGDGYYAKDGYLVIQMEYCDGGSFQDVLKTHSDSTNNDSIRLKRSLFENIVDGLLFIHKNGMMHRDIKPDNIFICGTGLNLIAKIGDLGLARRLYSKDGVSIHRFSRPGTVIFSSPEQHTGIYDEKTDMYPLGLILFCMFHPDISKCYDNFVPLTDQCSKLNIPTDFETMYPKECFLINKLVSMDPNERPSASLLKDWITENWHQE